MPDSDGVVPVGTGRDDVNGHTGGLFNALQIVACSAWQLVIVRDSLCEIAPAG